MKFFTFFPALEARCDEVVFPFITSPVLTRIKALQGHYSVLIVRISQWLRMKLLLLTVLLSPFIIIGLMLLAR